MGRSETLGGSHTRLCARHAQRIDDFSPGRFVVLGLLRGESLLACDGIAVCLVRVRAAATLSRKVRESRISESSVRNLDGAVEQDAPCCGVPPVAA
jgi:hypothetical protein